ncbi:hypothetical protein [Spirillospora sp. NPDC047279]|uniref:DUF7144 family membrane protein n=1 Tax=Spirillospora sp. NPDC047279 TaxID=3155478 RepID=UPI0033F68261
MDRASKDNWALGLAVFTGIMMILIGLFQAIAGLAAILDDEFYAIRGEYAFAWDATAWGWVHLIMGMVVFFAGWGVFAGMVWARAVGIAVVSLSAVLNFLNFPNMPLWSMVIIGLDVLTIWALAVYMRPYRET